MGKKSTKLRLIHPEGRYAIGVEIASGGMATIHLGRLIGPVGFSRTVAIKKLHPQLAKDPQFTTMFLDEARLAARIHHPNVVQTLDVVAQGGEVFLVMDYIAGESLATIQRRTAARGEPIPMQIAVTVITDTLHGLHAAHEATNEHGEPLHIVHRDVSPHNILVGADGISRVLDFGIAKAIGRLHNTREGQVKGKLAYMAPEQIRAGRVTRRTDIFAAAVVLWGALTGRNLFNADNDGELLFQVLEEPILPPSRLVPAIPPALDAVVMRALERTPEKRFATAHAMAVALEQALAGVTSHQVAEWLSSVAGDWLASRAQALSEMEILSTTPGALDATTEGAALPSEKEPPSGAPPSWNSPTAPSTASPVIAPDPVLAAAPPASIPRGFLVLALVALVLGSGFGAFFGLRRSPADERSAPGRIQAASSSRPAVDAVSAPPAVEPPASVPAPPTAEPISKLSATTTAHPGTHPSTAQPKPPPLSEPGFLTIVCFPSCDDVLDQGKSLGPSPVVKVSVKPGQHRITLKKGTLTKAISVLVEPGQTTTQSVSMKE